mgnify:CR=1 FL=1
MLNYIIHNLKSKISYFFFDILYDGHIEILKIAKENCEHLIVAVGTDEFMEKYHRHLKFSSVERTPIWEEIYYDAEVECDKELGDIPRGMGFCYGYWHTLQNVLAKRGIEWQSPKELNPRVMFD